MIDELLKVVKVDLSQGTKSVKDYADAMDDAKGSVDELNEALGDVKKTSEGGILKGVTAGFDEAIDATLDEIGKVDAEIGILGFKLKDYGKVAKAFFTSATQGLSTFKKALVGTGIGLLIVAATTLYARFDDVKKALGITEDSFKKFKDTALNVLKAIVGGVAGVGSVIVGVIGQSIKTVRDQFKQFGETAFYVFKGITSAATGNFAAGLAFITQAIVRTSNTIKENAADFSKVVTEEWEKGFAAGADVINALLNDKTDETTEEIKTKISNASKEVQQDLLKNTIDGITERSDYDKRWIEASILDEKEKAKRIFEIEQKGYEDRIKAYDLFIENFNGSSEEKAKLEEEREKLKNEAILADFQYTNEQIKAQEEANRLAEEQRQAEEIAQIEANRQYKTEMAELTISDEQALQDRLYEIKLEALNKEKALLNQQLANTELNAKEREKIEKQLALTDAKIKKTESDNETKNIISSQDRRKKAMDATLSTASNLFGSLSKLAGENSKAGKALAVAQTTIDTFQSAQAAYKAMAGIPVVGPGLGIAAAAAAIASGIANVKSILSTDEQGETSTPSASTPPEAVSATPEQIMPNVGVTPMLDEFRDLNQMQSLNVNGENGQRVYVVESDIKEVGNRVEVRESEATF